MTGKKDVMTDTRLIERWLPIAALGEENMRVLTAPRFLLMAPKVRMTQP